MASGRRPTPSSLNLHPSAFRAVPASPILLPLSQLKIELDKRSWDTLLKLERVEIAKVAELADAPDLGTENSTTPDDPKDKPP